jgi:hypothetical protein
MKNGEENPRCLFDTDEKYEWGTCPHCGASWDDHEIGIDSDTIPLGDEIEEARAKLSYYACVHLSKCGACKKFFYFVNVDLVANPHVSEGWINAFFWHNGGEGNYETGEKTESLLCGNRHCCSVEKIPTSEGVVYRYTIGPLVPEKRPKVQKVGMLFYDWPQARQTASLWINNFSFLTDYGPRLK